MSEQKKNGLAIVPSTMQLDYSKAEVVKTVRDTCAQGATDAEFMMFLGFAQSTGLNPLKKEIWFIKAGNKVQMQTGINGFAAIANAHPDYNGIEVETEHDEKGMPVKSTAKCWRKDRDFPSVGVAIYREDAGTTPIWKPGGRPTVMLEKVAKSRAWREAFPQQLNGLYSDAEIESEPRIIEHSANDVKKLDDLKTAIQLKRNEAAKEEIIETQTENAE